MAVEYASTGEQAWKKAPSQFGGEASARGSTSGQEVTFHAGEELRKKSSGAWNDAGGHVADVRAELGLGDVVGALEGRVAVAVAAADGEVLDEDAVRVGVLGPVAAVDGAAQSCTKVTLATSPVMSQI